MLGTIAGMRWGLGEWARSEVCSKGFFGAGIAGQSQLLHQIVGAQGCDDG